MKKTKKGAAMALATFLACSSAVNTIYANPFPSIIPSEASATPTGVLRGRIVSNDGTSLPGSVVTIEQLNLTTTTDVDGYFTFSKVPAGKHTLKVDYIGFESYNAVVKIHNKQTTEHNVTLNSNVNLETVTVKGVFQGQHRAINTQKSYMGVSNIVSSDQISKFPDSNIGDALKRMPGINVQYDQGEARFGQVRGTSADLSSVTINGNRIPSAEGDTRNVQLDLIPADMIQMVEVKKVVTPDMDADAIGGSINLITKNSPYKRFITATAGSGYNAISDKLQLNLSITYGQRFINNRLGVMLSASYQKSPAGSDDVEFVWDKDVNTGKTLITDYQIRQYYVTRERQSYSAAFDFDINKNNKILFKGIFNNRNDWETRYRLTLKDLNMDDDQCVETNKATVRIQTKGGTPDNRNARLERQRTMDFTLGGEHVWGRLEADWSLNYARASEYRPNERYIDYQMKKQKVNIDYSNPRWPLAIAQEGSTLVINDNFSLKEVTEQQEDIHETDLKFKADFKLPLARGKWSNKLVFGAKVVRKDKEKIIDFYEYSPLDEDTFDANSLASVIDCNRSGYIPKNDYHVGSFVSEEYLGSLDLNNPALFEKEQVQEELATNYTARETVTAGYIRFDQKLGENWDAMVGVRLENTHVKYSGSQYDADNDISTRTAFQSKSYINVLPSLLVKWNVNDDFKLRASLTNTLARPKYSALAPNISINRSDNSIELGNPELGPTLSYNLDLSAEYYFKSIGLVSAGVFYKAIDDFIVDQTFNNYQYLGTTYTRFTQPRNSGDADILGVELAFQRDFGFIAPALKCIGIYTNYTYTYSRVNNFQFEGRENEKGLRMPGSPEHTANASLFFDKWGFNVRLSYNYASAFIDEMGSSTFYDRYYDSVNYMDLNAGYTFGKQFKTTIYAEATNLLNQPLRYYQGTKEYTAQSEHYGIRLAAGVKVTF